MEKKKVLFFIYQMGDGGAARTILNIINNIDRTNFKPILVTLNYDGNYEGYLKSDITLIKLETKRLRSAILPLAKVIRNEKADIVFSTIPNYNTIALLAKLLSFTRAKAIVREAAYLGGNFKTNIKLIGYGLIYRLSSQVIALSKGVKKNLVERYKVNPKKIKVIYNPVDLDSIQDRAENSLIPSQYEPIFNDDSKVIITAGRLVKDKDHKTLLEAFARVSSRINVKLVILGEGKLETELKEQAKQLHIADSVFFLGFQRNPYVYFKHAELFVLSSLSEGFGHVLAEAMATGTPIVSTNCPPGAAEVLNNGEFGLLCEVGDADDIATKIYHTLTLSDEERTQMIAKGLKRVNEFNAKAIVQRYEETFVKTITSSDRG